jgi:hypothetical protein
MKITRKLLPLLMAQAILPMSYGKDRNPDFHLPDIPDDERIRVYLPKVKKHATKRRVNKSHERRRK